MTSLIQQAIAEAKQRQHTELSSKDLLQQEVDNINSTQGHLTGIHCNECLNRGHIAFIRNSYVMRRECDCMAHRRNLERIERSGLSNQIDKCTLDNYKTDEAWQKVAKQKALDYLSDHEGRWFFAGGQVGSGKTHLCTAIVGELLRQGHDAKYMLWRDEIIPLKKSVMDADYAREIIKYKKAKVLYIDDFFKTERGKAPTAADINIAFEVLNYRYNNPKLITIISSEQSIDDLLEIDEAVGSRIYEKAKDTVLIIGQDRNKNFRMKE